MIDTSLRHKFQPAFDIMAKKLAEHNIKPDSITYAAFFFGIMASLSVALGYSSIGISLLWFSGLLDVLDGSVARLTGVSTKTGAYMDMILDRMVEAVFIFALAYRFPEAYYAYMLFYIAVIFNFTTFIVAGALFQNTSKKSMHYDTGIAERTETFIVFTLLVMFSRYITPMLMAFNALIFLTGLIRYSRVIRYQSEI